MHVLFQFAYLDPGTGSLIIQSVVGAIAGVLVFGRRTITRAKLGLQSKFSKKSSADTEQSGAKKDLPAAVETKAASIDEAESSDGKATKKSGKSKR